MGKDRLLADRRIGIVLFLFNLLALSPLIVFSYIHFSVDTYGILLAGASAHLYAFLGSLRFFGALIYYFVDLTGHNPMANPIIDIVFYIIIVSFIITWFVLYVYRLFSKKSLSLLCLIDFSVLISITNVWFTNILTFPECIILTAVGVALCFTSIIAFSESKKWYNYILSGLLFVCAAGVYQQFVSLFFVYSIVIIAVKSSSKVFGDNKKLLFEYVKLFGFVLINSIIYYLISKGFISILQIELNERVALSISSIVSNIIYFITHQHSFLKGRGFFATEILTISYFIVIMVFGISFVMCYRKSQSKIKYIFIISSFLLACVSVYLPGLVSTSHASRTMFALFSVFALLSIGAVALHDSVKIKIVLCSVLLLVFSLNIYKTVDMSVQQVVTNTKEIDYVDNIIFEISQYEDDNDIVIDKIGLCYDNVADIKSESLYVDYAIKALFELRLNKKVEFIKVPEDICCDFESKNWTNYAPDEQLIFEEKALYLCIY